MSSILPTTRPKLTRADADKIVKAKFGAQAPKLVILGVRGYYSKMGATPGNDINLYDDAIFVVGTKYVAFNANTDPSFYKRRGKALAKIDTGNYKFYKGKHKGRYNALRAFPEGVKIPCTRDGKPSTAQYINIHKGGTSGTDVTWSEGCQTIPAPQWNEFINLAYREMDDHKVRTVDYILITNEEMKKILG
jgi:hypothetical protein